MPAQLARIETLTLSFLSGEPTESADAVGRSLPSLRLLVVDRPFQCGTYLPAFKHCSGLESLRLVACASAKASTMSTDLCTWPVLHALLVALPALRISIQLDALSAANGQWCLEELQMQWVGTDVAILHRVTVHCAPEPPPPIVRSPIFAPDPALLCAVHRVAAATPLPVRTQFKCVLQ